MQVKTEAVQLIHSYPGKLVSKGPRRHSNQTRTVNLELRGNRKFRYQFRTAHGGLADEYGIRPGIS